ncbi:MAG: outer membrane beta-barrel protein, partial [Bacteroidia bacterium]|nr:outer membrane beta-barrel protein [Bacteroidia bacterium]
MKTRSYFFIRLLLALLLISAPLIVLPQETSSCAENLRNAQSLFDRGQVERVPGMLSECLRSGFKREEELAAYKLIIQTYLFQDKYEQADSAMLAFLKKNPEYQLSPTDHSSFVHLYNNFEVKPVIQIVFHIGTNMPFMTFVDTKSVSAEEVPGEYNNRALNLFVSLEAKFAINSRLEVNIEGGYSQLSFSNNESFLGFAAVSYSEIQHRIEIPVTATYNIITFNRLTAYARAGAGAAFNLSTNAQKVSFDRNSTINFTELTGSDINRSDSRIKMDLLGQAGGGIKYKIPRGYLNLEIRMNLGIYNQVIRGGNSAELLEGYRYKDDDFNLNDLNFSIGYTQIFYKPSK